MDSSNVMLFLLVSVAGMALSESTKLDYMMNHCGRHITLSHEHARSMELQLTSLSAYLPYKDCVVTVVAERNMHIRLVFLEMDINSFFDCPGDFLQVLDGLREVTDKSFLFSDINGHKLCGNHLPEPITSEYNNITLRFVSDADFHGKGFTLLLTAYHEGQCRDDEYRCHNSRCIHESLYCDGFNHCGDDSDSCSIPPYLVAGYVLTSVILIIAIVFLGIVLRYRCSKVGQDNIVYDHHVDDVYQPPLQLSVDSLQALAQNSERLPTGVVSSALPLPSINVISCEQNLHHP